ncbi:hypothetical protein ES703_31837 [subsurface metagenome]
MDAEIIVYDCGSFSKFRVIDIFIILKVLSGTLVISKTTPFVLIRTNFITVMLSANVDQ